ncbi:hypothetical protein HK098_008152, partial [Nowakowskiella sp. JEL0407]
MESTAKTVPCDKIKEIPNEFVNSVLALKHLQTFDLHTFKASTLPSVICNEFFKLKTLKHLYLSLTNEFYKLSKPAIKKFLRLNQLETLHFDGPRKVNREFLMLISLSSNLSNVSLCITSIDIKHFLCTPKLAADITLFISQTSILENVNKIFDWDLDTKFEGVVRMKLVTEVILPDCINRDMRRSTVCPTK